ncbi:hypothetical protein ACOME3_006162 [Neoechinorhynchus agilis]
MYTSVPGGYNPGFGGVPGYGSMVPGYGGMPGLNAGACGGNVYCQTFMMPEPPPEHIVCRKRLPTPPPNVINQTVVVKPRRQVIHEVVEQPTCPPPVVRQNYVMGAPDPPQYLSSMVNVQPGFIGGGGAFGGMPQYGVAGFNPTMMGQPVLGGLPAIYPRM